MNRPPRARFPSVVFRHLLWTIAVLLPAWLHGTPITFDLPTQSAGRAILAFSEQGQVEVIFSSDDLRTVESAPVVGSYEPAEALALLLKSTGFTARRNLLGKFVVTRAPAPTGALRGRILKPDGTSAPKIRLNLVGTTLTTATDRHGDFVFPKVPVGTYTVVASGSRYQPLQITRVTVETDQTLVLDPQSLRAASDLMQLEAVVVEGRSARLRPFDRGQRSDAPRIAAGNLDLPRTVDDVLPYAVYDRQQISRSGVVSLSEFLAREVVDSDPLSRPPEQIAGLDSSIITGSTNLNLRGYKSEETILLVNGRRLPEIAISAS